MCGIIAVVGDYRYKNLPKALLERGRNDWGSYKDNSVQLIQTRHKITGGKVKLPYQYKKLVLLFNGEIYNWEKLAEDVGGKNEYEVILRMYFKYGPSFMDQLDGQFCIFIYNKAKREVMYFIDKFRIHTVYKSYYRGSLIYSSNLRSLPQINFKEKQSRGYGNISTTTIL